MKNERQIGRQIAQGTSPRSIVQATCEGRNAYLEFCSHAVWVVREKKKERERERREARGDKTGILSVARTPRATITDYKEEPLNRGPGPLQGTEVLLSWLTQRRGVSQRGWPPTPPHAVTHGPSSSITSGRRTRLQALLGSLPIGFAPHSCNQPTMTL